MPPEWMSLLTIVGAVLGLPLVAMGLGSIAGRQARAIGLAAKVGEVDLGRAIGVLVGWTALLLGGLGLARWSGWIEVALVVEALTSLVGRLLIGVCALAASRAIAGSLSNDDDRRRVTLGGAAVAGAALLGDAVGVLVLAALGVLGWVLFSRAGLATVAEHLADVAAGIRLRASPERRLMLGDQVLVVEQIGLTQTTFSGGDPPLRNELLLALRDGAAADRR